MLTIIRGQRTEFRIQNTEYRSQNLELRSPNPEVQTPNPKPQTPSSGSQTPNPNPKLRTRSELQAAFQGSTDRRYHCRMDHCWPVPWRGRRLRQRSLLKTSRKVRGGLILARNERAAFYNA